MTARFVLEPIVVPMAQMQLIPSGVREMLNWVKSRAPACVPDELDKVEDFTTESLEDYEMMAPLFPHDMHREHGGARLTDNELFVELAGRKCYNSFGAKAGRKSNREYIEHTQQGDVPHKSIMYHAKLSFFIAGVSRRVSHELIRNYVGADRTEEGAPSQESTRYVENAGFYIIPPRYLQEGFEDQRFAFEASCHEGHARYLRQVRGEIQAYTRKHGHAPKGMDYKRMLEAGSSELLHSVETSFIWTSNPEALAKLFKERDNEAADMEFQRFARKWKRVCVNHAPNLFPQPHMREGL